MNRVTVCWDSYRCKCLCRIWAYCENDAATLHCPSGSKHCRVWL